MKEILLADNHSCDVRVSKPYHYNGGLSFKVKGTKGSGIFSIWLKEDSKRVPRIKAFSEDPRMPSYPLIVKSASWTSDDEKYIEIEELIGIIIEK